MSDPTAKFAAVDLGSNSFKMLVARIRGSEIETLERRRCQVRLQSGLGDDGLLSPEALDRAIDALGQFGRELAGFDLDGIRVVATSTMRRARNAQVILDAAPVALGHTIEVIDAHEEARLTYLGAVHGVGGGATLVADIGGGSTECIIGRKRSPIESFSIPRGCISQSMKYFKDGRIDAKRFKRAIGAAHDDLAPIEAWREKRSWKRAIGTSGTMQAIAAILRGQGWSEHGITARGLKKLIKKMIEVGCADDLRLKGLKRDRAPILAGGVALAAAIQQRLDLDKLEVNNRALREGILFDLHDSGRILSEVR